MKDLTPKGSTPLAGYLAQDGILRRYPQLAGVIFRTKGLGSEIQYVALVPCAKFNQYGDLIVHHIGAWNDEKNSNAWQLLA